LCEILVVVGLDVALGTMVDMILEGTDDCVRRIGRVLFQHRSHETIQIELTATSSIKDAKCHFVNREEKERSDVDEYEYHCQFGEDHSDLVVRDVDKTASDQRPHGKMPSMLLESGVSSFVYIATTSWHYAKIKFQSALNALCRFMMQKTHKNREGIQKREKESIHPIFYS
jgi:hypothetical protein